MSHQLTHKGVENHIMIDAQKYIGDAWRFRYKSLVLFTPKSYSALPGLEMKGDPNRSEEHTSELQSRGHLVCRLLLEKKMLAAYFVVRVRMTVEAPSGY